MGIGLAVEPEYLRECEDFSLQIFNPNTAMTELGLRLKDRTVDPLGALMFSCSGRGLQLYGRSGVESDILNAKWGDSLAKAGFFAAGEIGPVGDRTYVHAFTSSCALFHVRDDH
mmetsp:Transcript_22192/g.35682  ORF Transcript_22192/g.35682 Transcript_22192/m.35682 type:complete len:114 (+) Transcript_22192:1172-1513(+)